MANKHLLLLLFMAPLVSCYQQRESWSSIDTTDLVQLQNVRVSMRPPPSGRNAGLSNLRMKSLRETAMTIGAQAGLAWASMKMQFKLRQDSKYLDTIYNFNAMMLTHGVLPPVLEQGNFSLNLADPNTIRVADRTYRIVKQARFATTAPNWREYIWLDYSKPALPDRTLLPRTYEEQCAWKLGIALGWEKGIQQAYSIFQQNLARLKRDFNGMIIYRDLLQKKMISQPFVARTELGVTGDGTDMRVNDQVLRIVELPKLQTNSHNWKAVVVRRYD